MARYTPEPEAPTKAIRSLYIYIVDIDLHKLLD